MERLYTTNQVIDMTGFSRRQIDNMCTPDETGWAYLVPAIPPRGTGHQKWFSAEDVAYLKRLRKVIERARAMGRPYRITFQPVYLREDQDDVAV